MKATLELKSKTNLEKVIESGNMAEIKSLIAQKEASMDEALENVTFYRQLGDPEKADIEWVRAKRLDKDIMALRASLK